MSVVAVFGLGKLGAPMAALLSASGHLVIGVDVSADTVDKVNAGTAPVAEPGLQDLFNRYPIAATTLTGIARDCDVSVIIVPTPSGPGGRFDDTMVLEAVSSIAAAVGDRDHTIVVASTVMPGTCRERIRPLLPPNIGLAYSPEFIALGSVVHDLAHPDMVLVGADDADVADVAARLVCSYVENGAPTMTVSLTEAELAKLALNVYVTTKIAFANALGLICDAYDADAVAVAHVIGTDSRIGRKYLRPGGPFAGPCFPRDGRAWIAAAAAAGIITAAAPAGTAAAINKLVVADIRRRIGPPTTTRLGVLGMAYKPGTYVMDESLGTQLATRHARAGGMVWCHDPIAFTAHAEAQTVVDFADVVVIAIPCDEYRALDYTGKRVIDPWRLLAS